MSGFLNKVDQIPVNASGGVAPDDSCVLTPLAACYFQQPLVEADQPMSLPISDPQLSPTSNHRTPTPISTLRQSRNPYLVRNMFTINTLLFFAVGVIGGSAILAAIAAVLPSRGPNHQSNLELSSSMPFALLIDTLFTFGGFYALLFEEMDNRDNRRTANRTGRSFCARLCKRMSYLWMCGTLSIVSVVGCWALWGIGIHTHKDIFFKLIGIFSIVSKILFFLTSIFFLLKLIKLKAKAKAWAGNGYHELASLAGNQAPPGTSDGMMV
jgi:hypothetical protein